ncbi:hypothetical protein N431DRAFT_472896 [Stipitochalara longipes BDJ]|nr:hypothetical protein N431DRAFT_472896 [Stipitochalara longipes BDJ]
MALPSASSDLVLTHPDPSEYHSLFASSAGEWKGALTTSQYVQQGIELVSLDSDPNHTGLQHADWILVDGTLPLRSRSILSSCETFQKRALVKQGKGEVEEKVIYGIASVFTAPEFRRRGYARRMLQLLAEKFKGVERCVGTLLFSDIGKKFYSGIGWKVLEGSRHLDFPVMSEDRLEKGESMGATPLLEGDLKELCEDDEAMLKKSMAMGDGAKIGMVIVPDIKHMAWHHVREDFICEKLFRKAPEVRGAMAGEPGKRVWVTWTRKYDSNPDNTEAGNILYILRLAVEGLDSEGQVGEDRREEVKENLKAVIESARREAKEWKLSVVRLWDPKPLVRELLKETRLDFVEKEREEAGIASLRLNDGVCEGGLEWLANERYAWC